MATVRCDACGREEVVDFGDCLANGWPLCHGYTMTLLTDKNNEAEARAAVDRALRVVGDIKHGVEEATGDE